MTERNTPSGSGSAPEDRDFADFIAGSHRLNTHSTLPLPDESGQGATTTAQPQSTASAAAGASTTTSSSKRVKSEEDSDISLEEAKEYTTARASAKDTTGNEDTGAVVRAKKKKPVSAIEEELRPEQRDRAEVIGTSVRWFAGWCLRFAIILGAAYGAAIAFGKLWSGILPILLSLIVCTVLWPVVSFLRKLKIPNALAVLMTLLGFFAVIIGTFAWIIPDAVAQGRTLVNQGADGLRRIQTWLQGPPFNIRASQFNDALDQATNWLQEKSAAIASTLANGAAATASVMVTLVIMMVLTFFFLKDGEKFLPTVRRITGRRVGWHLTEVLTRCWNTLGGFVRTQAIVSFIDAFFIGLGLVILGIPLAGPLALLTFFAGFIPMVGAFVAGTLSVLVALVATDFTTALIVLAIIVAVQQLEGNILQPLLQSRAMNVHPVVILLAVTLGSALFGVIGAFLAVPVAATLAVIARYLGDLTDLATGEKVAADIDFITTAGSLTGEHTEHRAQRRFNFLNRPKASKSMLTEITEES